MPHRHPWSSAVPTEEGEEGEEGVPTAQPPSVHPQQLASSYFGPAEAERLREYIFRAGGSGTEPFSPTVRLGDSELVAQWSYAQGKKETSFIMFELFSIFWFVFTESVKRVWG